MVLISLSIPSNWFGSLVLLRAQSPCTYFCFIKQHCLFYQTFWNYVSTTDLPFITQSFEEFRVCWIAYSTSFGFQLEAFFDVSDDYKLSSFDAEDHNLSSENIKDGKHSSKSSIRAWAIHATPRWSERHRLLLYFSLLLNVFIHELSWNLRFLYLRAFK